MLLALVAGYEAVAGTIRDAEVRHALIGAYRHAVTVGFITLVTMGVSARILPVFRGVDWQGRGALATAFWLVLIGNTLRVSMQIGAGLLGGAFYPLMGVSGWLEVTGLGLYGWCLWRTVDAPVAVPALAEDTQSPAAAVASAAPAGEAITATSLVGDVLEKHPETLAVFLAHGFDHLKNPVVRRTLARAVPVAHACHMRSLDLAAFLAELNAVVRGEPVAA